jgi:SAM-dependent methyltransferase
VKQTDWTAYYEKPFKPASLTRKITGQHLIGAIKKHVQPYRHLKLAELGGANSAFLEHIIASLSPSEYRIIDSNKSGLEKTRHRIKKKNNVKLFHKDILNGPLGFEPCDIAISVGLIEHFDAVGTKKAIKAHFDLIKPGGCAVITFPTPTCLYRSARWVAEMTGQWMFHDERPLAFKEVIETAQEYGQILEQKIIWPIVFTQGLIVCKKFSGE